ncbi:MAG: ABC transporter substrate-binding protein/permease [Bifidobacteriaceae bacterium]|jgi:putative lysine transport system permease protein|nr:ABC transporter substrate-binding protein/permease [Bifidobacteriaceae bacterium]
MQKQKSGSNIHNAFSKSLLCLFMLFIASILIFSHTPLSFANSFKSDEGQSANSETSGQFIVGMECNYEPFNWQNGTETPSAVKIGSAGYCDGYDVQIAKLIAQKLNKELVIKKIEWDGLQPALDSGVINAIIAGMTDTKERENGIDFTSPYYSSDMVMIVRNNSPEENYNSIQQFSGSAVIGQKNTVYDEVIDQIKGVKHATPKDTYPLLVYSLQNNEADGITAELPVAKGIVESNSNLKIVTFAKDKGFDADTSVSIGLKKGTKGTEFFESVQSALNSISQEKREQLMLNAINKNSTDESQAENKPPDNFFAATFWIFQNNWSLFLYGTEITILLAILGTIFGFIIGLALGLGNASRIKTHDSPLKKALKKIMHAFIKVYVFFFRGTPMMIQAIFMFYILRPVLHWEPLTAGIVVISINTGAYMSEIIRSGIQSVDIGQSEAAQSLGMTSNQQLFHIVLPQAIRNSFPSIGNQFVVNIKDSCVLNVIGVIELYFQSTSVSGSIMLFAQTFLITCIIYLILTFLAQTLLNAIEKKISLDGKALSIMEYSA